MKLFFGLLSLLGTNLFAQGTPTVYHLDRTGGIDLHVTRVDLGTGAAYSTFPFLRVDPSPSSGSLSGVSIPTTASITGSNSAAQSIALSSTDGFSSGDFILIDAGLSTQEMTQVSTVTDATHLSATFLANHSSGARIRKVYSSYTKYLFGNLLAPTGGFNNLTFIRQSTLPPNVYDQYRVIGQASTSAVCGAVQDSSTADLFWTSNNGGSTNLLPVPQYSTGSLTSTGNPSNGVDMGSSGPYTGSTPYQYCVQVSLMFTSAPEPSTIALDYRFYWDF